MKYFDKHLFHIFGEYTREKLLESKRERVRVGKTAKKEREIKKGRERQREGQNEK